jgi:hypothetical protein
MLLPIETAQEKIKEYRKEVHNQVYEYLTVHDEINKTDTMEVVVFYFNLVEKYSRKELARFKYKRDINYVVKEYLKPTKAVIERQLQSVRENIRIYNESITNSTDKLEVEPDIFNINTGKVVFDSNLFIKPEEEPF